VKSLVKEGNRQQARENFINDLGLLYFKLRNKEGASRD
jgi:hypothetical protein